MSEALPQSNENTADASMTSVDVAELYALLDDSGIRVWVDGGWGVDALLGEQTRPHADLDLAVEWKDVARLRQVLGSQTYREIRQESQWNFVLEDDTGREIDVHSFVFDAAGKVVDGIMYPAESLTGTGSIDGRTVRCISPQWMVRFHTGYRLRASDFQDVTALCERFGLEYPQEYKSFKKSD
jgi:lincosamide nucleotidyltransferase A/C/D/E